MPNLYRAPDGTSFSSRDEIDAQYDIEASVPDFGIYADRFVISSELARTELDCDLEIPYGPTRFEALDVFPGEPGGPIVIFIHGGYWKSLTSSEFSFVARGFVENGVTVVVPTYALCPTVTIDEIVRQLRAATAWTYRNAERYRADPNNLVVVGHSAGGHGVVRLMQTAWERDYSLPDTIIKGGCAISGLFDLRPLAYTKLQEDLRFTGEEILRNSPILNLPVTAPPLLVTHGGEQPSEFRRQSIDFLRAWQSVGLPGEYWERAGFNHFDEIEAMSKPDSDLTRRIIELADPFGYFPSGT